MKHVKPRIAVGASVLFLLLGLLLAPSGAYAQAKKNITVTGTVVDENKEPIIGANVIVRGTRTGVSTNFKGEFTLANVPADASVVVSFIGYKELTEVIGNRTKINFQMAPDAVSIEDVVVLPYGGMVAKKDLTGSVASVNVSDLNKLSAVTFENALAGKVAGVAVNLGDGQPGGVPEITIRGNNSVTQSNAPLYVVDGILMEGSDNSSIPTANIKSIEILKDASATAIYGARGANGVVVITTQAGSKGAPKLSFDFKYSVMKDYNRYDMMNAYDFVAMQVELDANYGNMYLSGRDPHPDGTPWTLDDYKTEPVYDWQSLVSQVGIQQDYALSLTGGSDRTTYFASFNHTNQKGIILNTSMKNYVGSLNVTQKLGEKITLNLRSSYASKERDGLQVNSGQGSGAYMYKVWSYRPIDTKGVDLTTELQDPDAVSAGIVRFNPLLQTKNTSQQYFTRQLRASAQLSWKILSELTFSTSISYLYNNNEELVFNNSKTEQGSILPGRNDGINGYRRFVREDNLLNENTLNYRKVFNKAHDLSLTAGVSQQTDKMDIFEARATQIPQASEWKGIYALDEGASYKINSAKPQEWAMQSWFFRLNYNYKSKYYVTYTLRGDGSSKFPSANRWGTFTSGALRWRFTQENFMKSIKWLNDGSLNLSAGTTGNNGIAPDSYLARVVTSTGSTYYDYPFQGKLGQSGAIVDQLENQKLKWETTYAYNLKLDLGFLNDRIRFTGEAYMKDTRDLLLKANLPAHIGYATAYRNIGRVQNRGLEFSVSTVNINDRGSRFRWTSDFNISFNRNKVVSLTDGQIILPSDQIITNGAALYVAKVGQPIGMMYGALTDGLYQFDDFYRSSDNGWILKWDRPSQSTTTNRTAVLPGFQRFKDLNGDLQITQDDMTIIGNPNPDFTGGFTNEFTWKNFDLNLFFTFSYGNDILNMNRFYLEDGRQPSNNMFASYANRWTMDNPEGRLPRLKSANNTAWSNDRYVEDGSYLRLRNLNFGYTLPATISQKFYVSNLYLYFQAQNLWTWTNYSGQDPTVSTLGSTRTPGYDYSAYPVPRTFIFGVKITF